MDNILENFNCLPGFIYKKALSVWKKWENFYSVLGSFSFHVLLFQN
jgi:hypothetical protein